VNREELRTEWAVALMASVEIPDQDVGAFESMLGPSLNWGEVIYQCTIHRTLNMLTHNLRRLGLLKLCEKELRKVLANEWAAAAERNRLYLDELDTLSSVLRADGVVMPVVKGLFLAHTVYPCVPCRTFNDLDLLMDMSDVTKATRILERLGYVQGAYDDRSGIVVEATRMEKLIQQTVTHELVEFQKQGASPFLPVVEVDVNHDVVWKKGPYKIPMADLIGRAQLRHIGSVAAYCLDPADSLIQLCCHLYKEATLLFWITDLRDLKIYKFADICLFLRSKADNLDWASFVERVRGYQIEKVVYFCMHHVELMWGTAAPQWVMEGLRPSDLGFLDEYAIENGSPLRWKASFFERLFDLKRVSELPALENMEMRQFINAKLQAGSAIPHRLRGETAKTLKEQ